MSDYFFFNDYSSKGELGISERVFERIATEAAKKVVKNHSANNDVRMPDPIKISFNKDGQVTIKVSISIRKGVKLSSISYEIQKEIARALEVYVESVPFDVDVSVVEFKK